jgi:uncharacterized protein (DUF433 family)/predicted nuclease of predicted toxin-antitoxin system
MTDVVCAAVFELQASCGIVFTGDTAMPTTYRIVADPEILGGKPVVEGTRISVELILTRLGEGSSVADILAEYPHLNQHQVTAAIDYARTAIARPVSVAAE